VLADVNPEHLQQDTAALQTKNSPQQPWCDSDVLGEEQLAAEVALSSLVASHNSKAQALRCLELAVLN
jgi:hypothetical protein